MFLSFTVSSVSRPRELVDDFGPGESCACFDVVHDDEKLLAARGVGHGVLGVERGVDVPRRCARRGERRDDGLGHADPADAW